MEWSATYDTSYTVTQAEPDGDTEHGYKVEGNTKRHGHSSSFVMMVEIVAHVACCFVHGIQGQSNDTYKVGACSCQVNHVVRASC